MIHVTYGFKLVVMGSQRQNMKILNILDNVPFTRCDNKEINNINNTSSMRFLESLPNVEIVEEVFSNMASNETNIELQIKY